MFKIHKKKRIVLSALIAAVLVLPAVAFAVNKIAVTEKTFAVTYNIPAGYTTITDPNFYDCVVSTFIRNYMNYDIDSLEEIQTNGLDDEQLNRIDQLVCNNSGKPDSEKIADVTGLEKMPRMAYLDLSSNAITTIDVSGFTSLTYLDLHSNQLTYVDTSGDTALRSLYLGFNQLTSVSLSSNTNLRTLDLSSNQLLSLDVSSNNRLVTLYVSSNQLTTLDVSNNTALTALNIDHNQLTSINLSSNTALRDLISDDIVIYAGIIPEVLDDDYVFDLSGLGFLADGYHEGYIVEFTIDDTSYYSYDKSSMILTVDDFDGAGDYIQINGADDKEEGGFSYKFGLPSILNFDVNGGTGSYEEVLCYPESGSDSCTVVLPATTPTKTNYYFLGWAISSSATTATYQPSGRFTFGGSQTLYAIWAPIRTLSYDSNGGSSAPASQTCHADDTISNCSVVVSLAELTKDDYEFKGWADSASATSATYQGGSSISLSGNKTIYAVWGLESTTVSLNFDLNGGTGAVAAQDCSIDIEHSTCVVTIPNTTPTKSNYYFLGWATSASATSASYQSGSSFTLSADQTLYAIWAPVYSLSYDGNGGSGVPTAQTCHPNTTSGTCSVTVANTTPTRANYHFLGWADSATATTVIYQGGASISLSANKTLYAIWAPVYSLSYDGNGGSGVPTAQTCHPNATSGTCVVTISNTTPTRSDYYFLGWATSASATSASSQPGSSFTLNADQTLYAIWAPVYSLSYDGNGGGVTPGVDSCHANNTTDSCNVTVSHAELTKNGYYFLGWADSATATTASYQGGNSVALSANKTLYAIWAPVRTLSYDVNGGSGAPAAQSCHPDNTTSACNITISSTEPTKTGYNFLGWADSATATEATYQGGDSVALSAGKTIYAVWELVITTVTLNFDLNGGEGEAAVQICTISVEYPTCTMTIHATVPTRDGYNFLGWADSATATEAIYESDGSIEISADKTIYAVWEKIGGDDESDDESDDGSDIPVPNTAAPDTGTNTMMGDGVALAFTIAPAVVVSICMLIRRIYRKN